MLGDKPNTIYVNNLNEKVKQEELKKSLNAVFSQFGRILDIKSSKSMKMRGQAFVCFENQSSAERALLSMNGFPFYDKPLRIQYAKTESDAVTKYHNIYVERPKVPRPDPSERKKKKSTKSDDLDLNNSFQPGLLPGIVPGSMVQSLVPNVFSTLPNNSSQNQPTPPVNEPNHILFVSNIPPETDEGLLAILFKSYPGFKEVRLTPGGFGIGFVEFENEIYSASAKDSLQGLKISPTHAINVVFANK